MSTPRLDVLICTFGKGGLSRVVRMDLPEVEGVRYIVSWQTAGADPENVPSGLKRSDIVISPTDTIGSSNNRNHAISIATAPLCLTADDDLRYTSGQLQAVIDAFDARPDMELASFRYSGPDNKAYPEKETALDWPLPRGFYSTSFEVAFRRDAVQGKIFYNPYFGINSPRLVCGDDSVFLLDCIRAGLKCRHIPIVITHHADNSSGTRLYSNPGFITTQGAYIRYAYGSKGALRLPLYAWRQFKAYRINPLRTMRHLTAGFLYNIPHGARHER